MRPTMSTPAPAASPPQSHEERDVLSVIAVLEALLAKSPRSQDRRHKWGAGLTRARTRLSALRAGDGGAPSTCIKAPPPRR